MSHRMFLQTMITLASPFFFNHGMALQAASVTPVEVECTWDENGADRLLAWGVVLLVLAAIASGAISFNFEASAGTR